jgi:hydrogenase maturation protease
MRSLVICIGNIARGDDAVAHRVAALVRERLPRDAELVVAPQLDVSMADGLDAVERVVIVDAEQRAAPLVDSRDVEAAPAGEFGHAFEPGHLLDIAYALYGTRPDITFVTLAAPVMEHDIGLSATAESAAAEGAVEVLRLLGASEG